MQRRKTAVVTGASQGIGACLANSFLERAQVLAPDSARTCVGRRGVLGVFGIGIGLWGGGAAGAILARAGVDPAAFGGILTGYTAAYLLAMSAASALAHRFGVGRVLGITAIEFGAALCALLNAETALTAGVILIGSGLVGGAVDVTMPKGPGSNGASAGLSLRGCMGRPQPAWRSGQFSAA